LARKGNVELQGSGFFISIGIAPHDRLPQLISCVFPGSDQIVLNKKNGFIDDRSFAKLTKRAKPTRTLVFQKLIDFVLIERKGGGRSTHYIFKETV
jgi:hypothetical protein